MLNNNVNKTRLVGNINQFCIDYKLSLGLGNAKTIDEFQIVDALVAIDEEMIRRIELEHNRNYVTDDVEREYMRFVYENMRIILYEQEADREFFDSLIKVLFHRRHYGYAYFKLLDERVIGDEQYSEAFYHSKVYILKLEGFYKTLYMSLVEFYDQFYGRFADNEDAIRLICKYYDSTYLDSELYQEEEDKIASALVQHVKNAGDGGDMGYAYHGIDLIKQYIGRLPDTVIDNLIGRYIYNEIITTPVKRKQVKAIIEGSRTVTEAEQYKKLYVESILVFDALKDIYNEAQEKQERPTINFYEIHEAPINAHEVSLSDSDGKQYKVVIDKIRWSRSIKAENQEPIFEVTFTGDLQAKYASRCYRINPDNETFKGYNGKFYLELKEFFLNESENTFIDFKLVYLNNYHGMKEQTFCFDKRFGYCDNQISYRTSANESGVMKYSRNISSIYAIVGKNGVGKTSILNFLSKEFVQLVYELQQEKTTVSDVIGRLEGMDGVEFLVVFKLGKEYYYLSSNGDEQLDAEELDIKRYDFHKSSTINRALSKVFYYSNKTDLNELFEKKVKQNEDDWRINDYSEQKVLRQNFEWELEKVEYEQGNIAFLNYELFYQLIFLRDCYENENYNLSELLWEDFSIENLQVGDDSDTKIIKTFIKKEPEIDLAKVEDILFEEGMYLRYFSSGQYAKFNFLAKLYWITTGYVRNTKLLRDLILDDSALSEGIIDENDSAILFIDEGDLYYHPEWQRCYISDLCKIIEASLVKYQIQVFIATNSPFILSDLQKENVIFLKENEENLELSEMKETFGQNIHTLLKKNFFMKYTIGEFARERIMQLFKALESEELIGSQELAKRVNEILKVGVTEENVYEKLNAFAEAIGEPIYREHLQELTQKHMEKEPNKQIAFLERRKKEIDEEIKLLKKRSERHDKNEEV